ncbi:MAG: trehalose-6-phosphate synthase [Deltaproteobacteria bacterium]|nr:trehalose-6-phosphate synthase [Deltaproteobacteria bacterium]
MSDLVIVSNRGPFSFNRAFLDEALECLDHGVAPTAPSFGEGGLVQAMAALLKAGRWNPTWIGASMGDRDIDVARGHYTRLFQRMAEEGHAPEHFPHVEIEPDNRMHFRYGEYDFHTRFVFFDTRHMHSYYNRFANGFLWPLMHLTRSPLFYKKTKTFPRPVFEKNDFIQYTSSGVTFANTVIDQIRKSSRSRTEGDVVVWNQDYHLMQIADVYRALMPIEGYSEEDMDRIRVGQFMHTPFFDIHEIQGLIREDKRNRVKAQSYDPFGETMESVLQKLTWGMLANDFIGFHTKDYCDNFLEALEEWFPVEIRVAGQAYEILYQGKVTTVAALPIGLDVDKILSEVQEGLILDHPFGRGSLHEKITEERRKGRILFGGLERCDYTKGLVERLSVFHHALLKLGSLDREARFFQVTSPSRHENIDYRNLNAILEYEVAVLNRKLGDEYVIHLGDGIPVPQNYRFMKQVDVMLVTPLEDGLNLVAFEYILSQKHREPEERGILALSTSGASRVLKTRGFGDEDGIIYVNPLRAKDAAERIVDALQKKRRISERVIRYTETERRVDDWAEKNVEAILNSRKAG